MNALEKYAAKRILKEKLALVQPTGPMMSMMRPEQLRKIQAPASGRASSTPMAPAQVKKIKAMPVGGSAARAKVNPKDVHRALMGGPWPKPKSKPAAPATPIGGSAVATGPTPEPAPSGTPAQRLAISQLRAHRSSAKPSTPAAPAQAATVTGAAAAAKPAAAKPAVAAAKPRQTFNLPAGKPIIGKAGGSSIQMKKGQGYNWLAGQLSKQYGQTITGSQLKKRMGGQMLYAGRGYSFNPNTLAGKGALTGGQSAKQIARAKATGWGKTFKKKQAPTQMAKPHVPSGAIMTGVASGKRFRVNPTKQAPGKTVVRDTAFASDRWRKKPTPGEQFVAKANPLRSNRGAAPTAVAKASRTTGGGSGYGKGTPLTPWQGGVPAHDAKAKALASAGVMPQSPQWKEKLRAEGVRLGKLKGRGVPATAVAKR